MTGLADVSVIMPAYNNAATIGRALASIAGQTLRPREVVVVDDGSADDTAAVAESWGERLGGVELVVLRQPNKGAGSARNAALAMARGDLVAFLDADDEWLPEKLAHSLRTLEAGMTFVSHDMRVVDAAGRESVMDCTRHFRVADPFLALMVRGFVATSTVVARRAAVVDAGGFAETLPAAQDYDLWLRLAAHGRFVVFAQPLTRYFVNPTGITAHVARRRQCSLAVLRRHLATLKGRAGGWRVALARVLVVQYEAASAFRRKGEHRAALAEVLRVPAVLLGMAAAWLGTERA